MSKRVLSLFLALVMLVLAVPLFALPTLADESDPTIRFAVGPTGSSGLNTDGAVIKTTTLSKKGYPTPADVKAAGATLDLDEVIGWYAYDKEADTFRSVKAYYSGYLTPTDGMTFYPVTKTTYMQGFSNGYPTGANQPLWTATVKTDPDTGKVTTYADTEVKTYTGGWVLGSYYKGDYKPFNQVADSLYALFTGWSTSQSTGAYYPLDGIIWATTTTTDYATAYAFHAVATGTVKITIPAANQTNCVLAIARNGTYVWPTAIAGKAASAAANDENRTSWGALNSAANPGKIYDEGSITTTLTLDVEAGDQLHFMLAKTDANGSPYFYPTVSYTNITQVPVYQHSTNFRDNRPNIEALNTSESVAYKGNWDYICYTYGTGNKLTDLLPLSQHYVSGKQVWFVRAGYSGYNGIMVYAADPSTEAKTSSGMWQAYGMGAETGKVIGTRYTAEYSGKIKVSYDRLLNNFIVDANRKTVLAYAIYVNGEKVWPVNDTGEWYTVSYYGSNIPEDLKSNDTNVKGTIGKDFADEVNGSMPGELAIEKGQTVEFLLRTVSHTTYTNGALSSPGSGGSYAQRSGANYVDGTVTYTEMASTVEAGVRVDGDLSIYGKPTNFIPYNEYGVYLNGEKVRLNEYYKPQFELPIAASEADELQTVQPYYVLNGEEILGEAYQVTMKDMLQRYSESEDARIVAAAAATLDYTAAAKAYFDDEAEAPEIKDPVNKEAYVAKKDAIGKEKYEGEGKIEFRGISLLLNDLINIKIVIDGTLPEGARLLVDTDINFDADAESVIGVPTEDGAGTKFIMEGISAENWNTDYYIRVVDSDGDAISDTLCYSVAAYYGRMIGREDPKLNAVISSLMALYEAVIAASAN